MGERRPLVWPDYGNCIANLPNSVLKKWGLPTVGGTLPLADEFLQGDFRNVVVLLLDGMGTRILESTLDAEGFFRRNLKGSCKSVFPSSTVAATTSVLSGLQPCEHSWLGWDCYYPQIDKNVTVFLNTVQGSDEPAASYNVARTLTPYESILSMIEKSGGKAYGCAPFLPPHPQSIGEMCGIIRELCARPGKKYVYAYWNQPDGLLHRNGCKSGIVRKNLEDIEKAVEGLCAELEDTRVLVTADHGHIDTDSAVLQDCPAICECLARLPSLEPRALNLFVRPGMDGTFKREFNREFGGEFLLMPVREALERRLFGTGRRHGNFRAMLGDYLAVATGGLSIYFTDERWASMHGGVTGDEMLIPLIVPGA